MASVHLARQPALDREVALKELHSAHVKDAATAHRFLNESRLAGALNHPSIVSMIEYFEHDGVPFIAMEYLERGSLRPLVGQLTLAQVAGVLDSVLGGLTEAAARGIVHRDLKPENVLITADGHAKVADFGIAKAIGQVSATDVRTATGQIVGTPAYMAPEQITSGEITSQVDLYATGLIAYELLAGRHPFHGTDAPMALLMRQVNEDPPPLASLRPDLPPGVVAWVHAMLAKEPAARPPGAAHAWDRLEGVVSDELGPRWRRAATLVETPPAAALATGTVPAAERSGVFSVKVPPVRAPGEPDPDEIPTLLTNPVLPAAPPAAKSPTGPPPVADDEAARRRGSRRRMLLLALATALLLALAAILYSTAPGEEPRAAPRPANTLSQQPTDPPLDAQLPAAIAPALAAGAALSRKLSALAPGTSPDAARVRVRAAIPATKAARAAVRELPASTAAERLLRARALRALGAQAAYLVVVRAALRLRAEDRQLHALGGLSARLVARLERIETAVPRASGTVGGARRLKLWVGAEVAAQGLPATVPAAPITPEPRPVAPEPVATATPIPTATPSAAPPPASDEFAEEPEPPIRDRPQPEPVETQAPEGW